MVTFLLDRPLLAVVVIVLLAIVLAIAPVEGTAWLRTRRAAHRRSRRAGWIL